METRRDQLEPDYFYHIYNRGINSEVTFKNSDNFLFFLHKLKKYLLPVSEIYAYCLMPNHFHLLIRVKSDGDLRNYFESTKFSITEKKEGIHSADSVVSKQFAKFLSSYTQAFNKYHNRHGSLFETPFKRIRIEKEDYLRRCLIYIHQNSLPLNPNLEKYDFSSYKIILSQAPTDLQRNEVIELFGDLENFKLCHQKIAER